jgi:hypothetical protein
MLTSKSIRLSAGVIAIVALLATIQGCAQSQSTSTMPTFAQSQSTPAVPAFENSPLRTINVQLCFANGCCYKATSSLMDNLITSLTPDPSGSKATVSPFEECIVVEKPGICESETGLTFCPPIELGRPPIQSRPGGICYFPPNTKIKC